ncbi:unnamed protein product [Hermetia illucens]|uniref:Uncharacterized protein n=1 Tax=Hermetia illucens TaxID=343691 RepID=A0A7R8UQ15_HERIL|nr:unnamed protein product [Hermetia illucens]
MESEYAFFERKLNDDVCPNSIRVQDIKFEIFAYSVWSFVWITLTKFWIRRRLHSKPKIADPRKDTIFLLYFL